MNKPGYTTRKMENTEKYSIQFDIINKSYLQIKENDKKGKYP